MLKFTIKRVGIGNNVWKWRLSTGRGLIFNVVGYYDSKAEAEAAAKKG